MPEIERLKARLRAANKAAQERLRQSGYRIMPFDYSAGPSFLATRAREQRFVKVVTGNLSDEELRLLQALCEDVVQPTSIEVWHREGGRGVFRIRRVL